MNMDTQSPVDSKKMRTKDLIFAGAFGAIYLVLMLIVVMVGGAILMLYLLSPLLVGIFFFNDTATTEIYTLSLHDALPI